jgi:hypothetical protein
MPHHRVHRYPSTERTLSIFGISFSPVTGKWSTFSEDTKIILSEHTTEDGAHAACRRYEAAAWRRLTARPLADLTHRSI